MMTLQVIGQAVLRVHRIGAKIALVARFLLVTLFVLSEIPLRVSLVLAEVATQETASLRVFGRGNLKGVAQVLLVHMNLNGAAIRRFVIALLAVLVPQPDSTGKVVPLFSTHI